jgi:hypothetical protein
MAGGGTRLNEVRALSQQLAGARHRGCGTEVTAAVGKRVLGDADDPDDAGVPRRKQRAGWSGSGKRAAQGALLPTASDARPGARLAGQPPGRPLPGGAPPERQSRPGTTIRRGDRPVARGAARRPLGAVGVAHADVQVHLPGMRRIGPACRNPVRGSPEGKRALAGRGADDDPVAEVSINAHAEDLAVETGQCARLRAVDHRLLKASDHARSMTASSGAPLPRPGATGGRGRGQQARFYSSAWVPGSSVTSQMRGITADILCCLRAVERGQVCAPAGHAAAPLATGRRSCAPSRPSPADPPGPPRL